MLSPITPTVVRRTRDRERELAERKERAEREEAQYREQYEKEKFKKVLSEEERRYA
jgi:hypothetical protein